MASKLNPAADVGNSSLSPHAVSPVQDGPITVDECLFLHVPSCRGKTAARFRIVRTDLVIEFDGDGRSCNLRY